MNISRIAAFLIPFLLGSACSASAASVKASRAAEPKRPNIILFLVDDMGWQDTSLPFWREEDGTPKPTFLNKRYRTPNMEKLAAQLPTGFGLEWTAMSYQERLSGAQAPALYAISLLVVFLCLAALYESWSVPFSVMLVVPLGVIGALLATWMRGLENDVYFQVGLLTVIGLSAKNAILIVEFANELNEKGEDLLAATLSACRQRLRPILMTSLAFGFGVLPLAIATGAGAGSQNAIGTGVLGGTISATLLGIFFVPLFYVVIKRIFPDKSGAAATAPAAQEGR